MKLLSKSFKLWLKLIYVSFSRVHKDCFCHLIFTEPWPICQNLNVSTNILQSYTKILYHCIQKYHIRHPIFAEPWLIYQDPIVFTNIIPVIRSLHNLNHLSGSNPNIVWVVSLLIHNDPTQNFFSIFIGYFILKQMEEVAGDTSVKL